MKKIIDSKLYLWFTIACFGIFVTLACVSLYSVIFVEKEVKQLLGTKVEQETDQSINYTKAYMKLRSPQIFAGYDFFDAEDSDIKKILSYFDSKISSNENGNTIDADDVEYLYVLLDRRMYGSSLGIKTSLFFLITSLFGLLAFLYEKKQCKANC
jgi:hypothetical protein